MKQETKNKIKKIAKIGGFVITFGFAVFGVLCAAILMANGSGAKDNIKTLDSSLVLNEIRTERNSKPRKSPDLDGAPDLLDVGSAQNVRNVRVDSGIAHYQPNAYFTKVIEVEKGFYYFRTPGNDTWINSYTASLPVVLNELQNVNMDGVETILPPELGINSVYYGASSRYLYLNAGVYSFSCGTWAENNLYFADTLNVPAQDVVSLPAKWSPLGMFGGSISEDGNILTNTEWTTGYEERIVLQGFLFRNQGIVYNRMRIILYWLGGTGAGNQQIGYVDAKGEFHVGLSSQWCIRSIEYAFNNSGDVNNNVDDLYRFTAGQTRIDFTDTKVSVYPGIVWQNEGANVLEIIDKEFSSNGTRYTYGGLSIGGNLTDYEFLNKYNNIVALEVMGDTSNVFTLMTSAFGSVIPLLSIAILPNITLGMLLFLPLIGGIIVVIIKVIKK